ncbi:MAG: DUF4194 domain-containing protein [Marinobacter sp.]|uniref:DUF4194 domain-containing protein n=1 Tax=Marinobacter sp. TaxID=50741 RepID=UPI001B44F6EA|nr:DUF4194 domain-containing protein [Marinobacter sp.]MBQ0745083.1 DUF4194 domain-containing protein [Marinobacter sp.]MBQ0813438.1 DUF4194 domain-containing protein [Marinobacter sp.]
MPDIFDQLTAKTEEPAPDEHNQDAPVESTSTGVTGQYTSKNLKATAQELLKYGLLEADRKPNLYQVAINQTAALNSILEPLDLRLKVDDIRGLAFLVVSDQLFSEEDDEWSHPLMRRQRLTMEQSLLIAILRQHFIAHEQEAGVGAGDAVIELDELLPQIQLYLGDTGSDAREQKRLRNLLDNLKNHGIVSEIDANEQVIIRPIITHLANPENLQNLLHHFRKLAGQTSDAGAETP